MEPSIVRKQRACVLQIQFTPNPKVTIQHKIPSHLFLNLETLVALAARSAEVFRVIESVEKKADLAVFYRVKFSADFRVRFYFW
jgi:hypothetical protein